MNMYNLLRISNFLEHECEKFTEDYRSINPDVRFCLYQDIDKYEFKIPFSPYDIAKFYNENWTGNEDFMHVPNYNQVLEHIRKYPVIVAYNKKTKELLGISTLKYDENTKTHVNPYFPEDGARFFEMTGILTNRENVSKGLRGIGNKIYEIELAGAALFKQMPGKEDTRIISVIDCRNKHSINALRNAAENFGKDMGYEMKNTEFPSYVTGCYFIVDSDNELTEAPTLVVEVGLDPRLKTNTIPKDVVYKQNVDLNKGLLKTVFETFEVDKNKKICRNIDEDLGGAEVVYVSFDKDKNELKDYQNIITNDTEKGNNRIPLTDKELIYQSIDENLVDRPKKMKLILPDGVRKTS